MRQINFVIIFVICLALVLFGIENTEPAVIHVIKGVELQAPLCVELIVAMGVGAVMAWIFSVWASVQRMITVKKDIQQRENRITQLEEDVERYRMELEEQRFLPASQDPLSNAMQPETAEMVG
jgi:uncharacterized integral membrane protein